MSFVVGFAGKIGSGKTTIAQYASVTFNIKFVSFGDYVKRQAYLRKMKITRKNLQNLGQMLYEEDEFQFCQDMLNYHNWDGKSSLVIDGIRHLKANTMLKKIVTPLPYFLVFVNANDQTRKERIDLENLALLDNHPTEKAVQQNLIVAADYLIDSGIDLSNTKTETFDFFNFLVSTYDS